MLTTAMAFVGLRFVATRHGEGGVRLHPFAASAAGARGVEPMDLPGGNSRILAVGLAAQSVVLLRLAGADSLQLVWYSRRGNEVRRCEIARRDFEPPTEAGSLELLLPASSEDASSRFLVRDADARAFMLGPEGLALLGGAQVAAMASTKGGPVLGVCRSEQGWRLAAYASDSWGPPMLVPQAGDAAFLGNSGRNCLPWGLTALERAPGDFLLGAGSAEECRIELPVSSQAVGVARSAGSTGDPCLVCLREDERTVSLMSGTGERSLPASSGRCVSVALSTLGPFVATLSETGEVVVRSLTGPGNRRLYRHRPQGAAS